jgi:serine/threonine protein kinase
LPSVELPGEYANHLERQGFMLSHLLGQGLSGSVYLAIQPSLNRKVAVKFFDSAFVRGDAAMRKRFSREAKILARFQHRGLPYVLTEGIVQAKGWEAPYFVMEYIEGQTLRELLQRGERFDQRFAIDYATQILDALGYAHSHKIVHRDIKPGNVMIDQRGRCFLIDFSIGVSFQSEPGLTRATKSGDQLGTVAYSSPEQLQDPSSVDSRADIYSMGIVLLEMLTGYSEHTNISGALSGFPRSLAIAIQTACSANPKDRYNTAEDFIRALDGGRQWRTQSLSPALAICTNTKCPGADWSQRGFYRGPNVIAETTDSFCTVCGGQLVYQCPSCGIQVTNTPYCGNCGAQIYRVPECQKCRSWLTREYMDSGGANGCMKCSKKTPASPPFSDFSDDIPF